MDVLHALHDITKYVIAAKCKYSELHQAGATVESIDLPDLQQGVGAMYQLATADILKDSSNLGKMMSELGFAEVCTCTCCFACHLFKQQPPMRSSTCSGCVEDVNFSVSGEYKCRGVR